MTCRMEPWHPSIQQQMTNFTLTRWLVNLATRWPDVECLLGKFNFKSKQHTSFSITTSWFVMQPKLLVCWRWRISQGNHFNSAQKETSLKVTPQVPANPGKFLLKGKSESCWKLSRTSSVRLWVVVINNEIYAGYANNPLGIHKFFHIFNF